MIVVFQEKVVTFSFFNMCNISHVRQTLIKLII